MEIVWKNAHFKDIFQDTEWRPTDSTPHHYLPFGGFLLLFKMKMILHKNVDTLPAEI